MRERRVNSAERAAVFVQIEDQLRVAGLGQFLVLVDLRVGGVDDDSQTTDDGSGRRDHSLDHRDAFDLEPGFVLVHSRTTSAGLNESPLKHSAISCAILPGKIALSAIGKFQIKRCKT